MENIVKFIQRFSYFIYLHKNYGEKCKKRWVCKSLMLTSSNCSNMKKHLIHLFIYIITLWGIEATDLLATSGRTMMCSANSKNAILFSSRYTIEIIISWKWYWHALYWLVCWIYLKSTRSKFLVFDTCLCHAFEQDLRWSLQYFCLFMWHYEYTGNSK